MRKQVTSEINSFPYHFRPECHFPLQCGKVGEVSVVLKQDGDMLDVKVANNQSCKKGRKSIFYHARYKALIGPTIPLIGPTTPLTCPATPLKGPVKPLTGSAIKNHHELSFAMTAKALFA